MVIDWFIDTIIPIGRGQRQLILGNRYTGKTYIIITTIISNAPQNLLASNYSIGTRRLFSIYIAINHNLSKMSKIISLLVKIEWSTLLLTTISSSPSFLSFTIAFTGVSIAERIRDRGLDSIITFDDLSKHSKSYRQISLLLSKIPSRDAFPADIFNVHSTLLERCSKLNYWCNAGSITAFPIIETINSDITEYIATNVISITDGQLYLSQSLFMVMIYNDD